MLCLVAGLTGGFGHPNQHRAISLRAKRRFCNRSRRDYVFLPPDKINFQIRRRMIGNAVPVRLGEVIGESLVRHVRAFGSDQQPAQEDRIRA